MVMAAWIQKRRWFMRSATRLLEGSARPACPALHANFKRAFPAGAPPDDPANPASESLAGRQPLQDGLHETISRQRHALHSSLAQGLPDPVAPPPKRAGGGAEGFLASQVPDLLWIRVAARC